MSWTKWRTLWLKRRENSNPDETRKASTEWCQFLKPGVAAALHCTDRAVLYCSSPAVVSLTLAVAGFIKGSKTRVSQCAAAANWQKKKDTRETKHKKIALEFFLFIVMVYYCISLEAQIRTVPSPAIKRVNPIIPYHGWLTVRVRWSEDKRKKKEKKKKGTKATLPTRQHQ